MNSIVQTIGYFLLFVLGITFAWWFYEMERSKARLNRYYNLKELEINLKYAKSKKLRKQLMKEYLKQ